jgi:hypothetical protein
MQKSAVFALRRMQEQVCKENELAKGMDIAMKRRLMRSLFEERCRCGINGLLVEPYRHGISSLPGEAYRHGMNRVCAAALMLCGYWGA